jgi:cytoskeleton protein RodZ
MSEIVGQQLRQAREARKFSREQAAVALHIRLRYVEAMEAGDFSAFASDTQARGFLRTYAHYLDLDAELLLDALDGNLSLIDHMQPSAVSAAAPETESPANPSGKILSDVGQRLRSQREMLGLSLEDVERQTRLRLHYLQALETGRLEELPSPVQGRGMLKNYAVFIGLDPEAMLLRYAEGLQARLKEKKLPDRQKEQPRRRSTPRHYGASPIRALFSVEFLLVGILALLLVGFVGWGAVRVSALRSHQVQTATIPSIGQALARGGTSTPTPPLISSTPSTPASTGSGSVLETLQPAPPTDISAPVQIYVVARQRAWMWVAVDGNVKFDGRVVPGGAYSFAGDNRIEFLTGNGAALQVYHNRNDLGTVGSFGEVVRLIFTVQSVQTPTPTITLTLPPVPPTLTPTPTPSATKTR